MRLIGTASDAFCLKQIASATCPGVIPNAGATRTRLASVGDFLPESHLLQVGLSMPVSSSNCERERSSEGVFISLSFLRRREISASIAFIFWLSLATKLLPSQSDPYSQSRSMPFELKRFPLQGKSNSNQLDRDLLAHKQGFASDSQHF